MYKRDLEMIKTIETFHCLTAYDLIKLYFPNHKEGVNCCNKVLRRLTDRGYIKVNRSVNPYVYFPAESTMGMNSQKIRHFQTLFTIMIDLKRYGRLSRIDVEPKLGKKGTVEPDLFVIWNNSPFFIENQLSNYSHDIMLKKLVRYEQYRQSQAWKQLDWQPSEKKYFPKVWIIGERQYQGFSNVIQTKSVKSLLLSLKK